MENKESNFVKIIREICAEEEILCHSYSDDWAFCLEKDGCKNFILGYQFGLNLSVSQQIAADKSVASEIMTKCGIPNVEHYCIMAPHMFQYTGGNGNWKQMITLLEKYKDLVCKDNQGTGGHLVYRVRTQRKLEEAVSIIFSNAESMAISPYYEIEQEYRVILLDGEIKVVFRKERQYVEGNGTDTVRRLFGEYFIHNKENVKMPAFKDLERILKKGERYYFEWKHNLGQGALACVIKEEDGEKDYQKIKKLANDAVHALGLRFASADIVQCKDGLKVLEINSGVMMENLAGMKEEYYGLAKEIYRKAIQKMLSKKDG